MRTPIQYALTYPDRRAGLAPALDLAAAGRLRFSRPDMKKFRCLELAYAALDAGGAMPAVYNAANEAAVGYFADGRLGFTQIPALIEKVMDGFAASGGRNVGGYGDGGRNSGGDSGGNGGRYGCGGGAGGGRNVGGYGDGGNSCGDSGRNSGGNSGKEGGGNGGGYGDGGNSGGDSGKEGGGSGIKGGYDGELAAIMEADAEARRSAARVLAAWESDERR
jgi:hypothetical protein